MFIFLGDSQPMGYELGIEVDAGSEFMPKYMSDKIFYTDCIAIEARPDLAYPHLLSESLSQDYINLSIGGTSHMRHLDDFQRYLTSHEVPPGSTVILNSNCKHRGFTIDFITGEALDFMNNRFMNCGSGNRHLYSDWNAFLEKEGTDIWDFCMRINVYQNIQSINHIGLLCDSRGLNFLYFPIAPNKLLAPGGYEIDGSRRCINDHRLNILSLRSDQIFEPKDPYSERKGHWLDHHLSCKGHEAVAQDLKNVYLERFT